VETDVPTPRHGLARECRNIVPARREYTARHFEQLIRTAEKPISRGWLFGLLAGRVAGDKATATMLADNRLSAIVRHDPQRSPADPAFLHEVF
jgi:hypothetical protein